MLARIEELRRNQDLPGYMERELDQLNQTLENFDHQSIRGPGTRLQNPQGVWDRGEDQMTSMLGGCSPTEIISNWGNVKDRVMFNLCKDSYSFRAVRINRVGNYVPNPRGFVCGVKATQNSDIVWKTIPIREMKLFNNRLEGAVSMHYALTPHKYYQYPIKVGELEIFYPNLPGNWIDRMTTSLHTLHGILTLSGLIKDPDTTNLTREELNELIDEANTVIEKVTKTILPGYLDNTNAKPEIKNIVRVMTDQAILKITL